MLEKSIKISEETHQRLIERGMKGETFDDIIVSLLDMTDKSLGRMGGGSKR